MRWPRWRRRHHLPDHIFSFWKNKHVPEREARESQWKSRNIEPIFYTIEKDDHKTLKLTLEKWANIHSNGLGAKRQIISEEAFRPIDGLGANQQYRMSYRSGVMMWALRDADAARFFADMKPCPPLAWLDVLNSTEFEFEDLPSFGHEWTPKQRPQNFSSFSLIRQKTTFEDAPFLSWFDERDHFSGMRPAVLFQLARWLVRHLHRPELALWIASRPYPLGSDLSHRIALNYKSQSLAWRSPTRMNGWPPIGEGMRKIWKVILADMINRHNSHVLLTDGLSKLLRESKLTHL